MHSAEIWVSSTHPSHTLRQPSSCWPGCTVTLERRCGKRHSPGFVLTLVLSQINSCLDDQIAISSQKERQQHNWGKGMDCCNTTPPAPTPNTALKSSPCPAAKAVTWLRSCNHLGQSQSATAAKPQPPSRYSKGTHAESQSTYERESSV